MSKKFGEWEDLDLKGKVSGSIKTFCPECRDRRSDKNNRSVNVNIDNGLGRCYYCDSYFVDKTKESMESEKTYELPPQAWENHTTLSDKMVKWVKNTRGISQKTLVDNKITEEVAFIYKDNKEMNCITFNYFKDGILVSKKFRSATKGFAKSKDSEKTFYGQDDIVDSEYVVVVEGEFDKLAFWEAGVKNVISVPNGATDTSLFKDNQILTGKKIVVAVDTDDSGVKLENAILEIFGKDRCYKVTLPNDCKDANDVLVKHGAIALEKCYKNKIKYSVLGIGEYFFDKATINKSVKDFLTGKIKVGYTIGIEAFDNHFAYKEKEFYVLTARKGIGKTTLNQAIQVMGSVANGLKWVVAFAENDPWSMKLNYLSYVLGDYAKDVLMNDPERYESASKWVDEHFLFLKPTTIKEAIDVTKMLIEDMGINIFAIMLDPINSFMTGWSTSGNSYNDSLDAAIRVQKFCMNYCSVFINQHPIMSEQRSTGAISSYSGEGGQWLNKASFTYTFHRDRGTNINGMIVDNVRTRHTGGSECDPANPVAIHWSPTRLDIGYMDGSLTEINVIQKLVKRHRPFSYPRFDKDMENISDSVDSFFKPLDVVPPPPNGTTEDAWSTDNRVDLDDIQEDVPF